MRVALLHLSDIHFRYKNDVLTERAEAIGRSLQGISSFDACIIAVSGDVAFSGRAEEYEIAYAFFDRLRASIGKIKPNLPIAEVYIPGNHDVSLPDEERRSRAHDVQGVLKDVATGKPDDYMVQRCLAAQANFFDHFLAIRQSEVLSSSRLRYSVDVAFGDISFRFHCYNTAFLSQRNERKGELVAPTWLSSLSEEVQDEPASFVVSMLHHPYGWLEANNSRAFRRQVEQTSDIVLTGHEHLAEQYNKQASRGDQTLYFEADVLQENGVDSASGFHAILLDTVQREHRFWQFRWKRDYYETAFSQEEWKPLRREGKFMPSVFEPTDAFLKNYLNDPGAKFTHPAKELTLADIFVYPDIEEAMMSRRRSGISSVIRGASVYKYILEKQRVLITGSERSSKTSLAKTLWSRFFQDNHLPISVSGSEFKNIDENNFRKVIDAHIAVQYGATMVERYWQADRGAKVLIIDDLHRCRMNRLGVAALLDHCFAHYDIVVALANNNFTVQGLTESGHDPAASQLLSFKHCQIKELGHRLRLELIERWHRLGREHLEDQSIQHQIQEAEKVINQLLGRNLLPSSPFFVLTLLQLRESQTAQDSNLGAYGYHYEALITTALNKALKDQNSREAVDTIYTYLSRVAAQMFEKKRRYLTDGELNDVIDSYKTEFGMRLSSVEVHNVLTSARLLTQDVDGQYNFSYRYVYCYFVARFLREELQRKSTEAKARERIDGLIDKLHIEDFANILVFLLYFTKDEETITTILKHAKTQFSTCSPCDLDSSVEFLKKLNGKEPLPLLIDVSDVHQNNLSYREGLDEAEAARAATLSEQDELELYEQYDQVEETLQFNHALKTLDVMGQILRNFPGSLPREMKREIATECYMLGLRSLSFLYELIAPNLEGMRHFFSNILRNVRQIENREELAAQTDSLIYDVSFAGSYWMLKRISYAVGLEQLSETYKEVSIDEATLSQSLIDLCIKLDHFRSFPQTETDSIYNELTRKTGTPAVSGSKKSEFGRKPDFRSIGSPVVTNVFAYNLLRQMLCNHFYLYPMERSRRESLCAKMGIQVNDVKVLGGWDKMLPSSANSN